MPALSSGILGALDPTSDRAVFRQIADQLREAIDRGRFREGDKLPSEAELVEHYGVSRMTVRNSFSILQGEGLVHAEHGKGVFVRPRPPVRRLASDRFARRHREQGKSAFIVEADAAGSHPQVDSLEVKEEKASQDISTRLGSVRRVLARRRRYLLDGRPVEFATSYLPLDIARGTQIAEPNPRSEEHTSELQSHVNLVCRLLLEKKKKTNIITARLRRTPLKVASPEQQS